MSRKAGTTTTKGPVSHRATLFSRKRVGDFWHLTLVADPIARRARPGSMVSIAVGGELSSAVARRSFAVHRVRPAGVYGGTVEVVVDPVEPGAAWLAGLQPRDPVDLIGPLGRPFSLPREPVACALVGVGSHAAPLFALGEQLRERRCGVHMVLGAAGEHGLFGVLDARRSAQSVTVTTEDGSVGIRGSVTAPLADLLVRSQVEVVYAAGPLPQLRDVSAVAVAHGTWVQALVDVPMPCGTGLCQACVLPVSGEDGIRRLVRACTEGPVLPGDRVDWKAVS
jgi:dihydroorotate dehydrogenase electron transfer subunit